MARVRMKGGDRVYESTEGCREGASNPDPIEASSDAAVPREAPTDAVSPTEAPMDAELEVPSVPELSDKEEKEEASESKEEEVGEHDKEVSESKEEEVRESDKEEEVRELSIDGQGCDDEEEERVSDAEGRESSGNKEDEEVAGVKGIAEEEERVNDVAAVSAVDKGFAKIMEKFAEMDSKVSMLDGRVKELEGYVAIQLEKERYNEYHPGTSSDFVPTYCTPTANQPIASPTKALVLHSGFTDPKPIQIQELSDEGDQEQLARKEKENKKKKAVRPKHSGPTIQTGKKRQRKASRFQAEEFTAEGKGKGKKRQKK